MNQHCLVFQGKTLTTIALILTNFHKGQPLPVEKCVSVAVCPFQSICSLSDLCSTIIKCLFTCVQEERSSPIKAKTTPQKASKLEGALNFQ